MTNGMDCEFYHDFVVVSKVRRSLNYKENSKKEVIIVGMSEVDALYFYSFWFIYLSFF